MKQQINMELLKQVDEVTEERIAEEFPIDLEKEGRFERAYQSYLEKLQEREASAAPIKHYRMRLVSAIACCVLVLGAAYAIRVPEHQIPSIPDETVTETITSIPSTESPSNPIAEESTKPETSQFQADGDASIRESENTAPEIPPSTESSVTDVTGSPNNATSILPFSNTDSSVTTPFLSIQTTTYQTPEIIPTDPVGPTYSESDSVTTSLTTDSLATESQATECSAEPTDPILTDNTEVTDPPEIWYDVLPGFQVILQDGYYQITYTGPITPSPDELLEYTIDSDGFMIYSIEKKRNSCTYEIQIPDDDRSITVHQYERTVFSRGCAADMILSPETVNDGPGYWMLSENSLSKSAVCGLVWDDGSYTFLIEERYPYKEYLLPIAEALRRS